MSQRHRDHLCKRPTARAAAEAAGPEESNPGERDWNQNRSINNPPERRRGMQLAWLREWRNGRECENEIEPFTSSESHYSKRSKFCKWKLSDMNLETAIGSEIQLVPIEKELN